MALSFYKKSTLLLPTTTSKHTQLTFYCSLTFLTPGLTVSLSLVFCLIVSFSSCFPFCTINTLSSVSICVTSSVVPYLISQVPRLLRRSETGSSSLSDRETSPAFYLLPHQLPAETEPDWQLWDTHRILCENFKVSSTIFLIVLGGKILKHAIFSIYLRGTGMTCLIFREHDLIN